MYEFLFYRALIAPNFVTSNKKMTYYEKALFNHYFINRLQ
jgi:hypothetical protein